jgi:hypothetical protein
MRIARKKNGPENDPLNAASTAASIWGLPLSAWIDRRTRIAGALNTLLLHRRWIDTP